MSRNPHPVLEKPAADDQAIPAEVLQVIAEFVRLCPFRKTETVDWSKLPISLKRDPKGWHFTCELCSPSTCTGYIKDSPPLGKN